MSAALTDPYGISHEDALDLAAERLDFELEYSKTFRLDHHLTGCPDCAEAAASLAEDKSIIVDAPSDDEGDDEDDGDADAVSTELDGPPTDPDDFEDDESSDDGSGSPDDEDGADKDESHSRPEDRDDDSASDLSDDDFESDEPEKKKSSKSSDEGDEAEGDESETSRGRSKTDEEKSDEGDEPEADGDSSDDGVDAQPDEPDGESEAPEGKAAPSEPDPEDEKDDAAAEAMSDKDLADLDPDSDTEPEMSFPTCAADAVEDAAKENGAQAGDYLRRRADKAVASARDLDDDGAGSKVDVCRSTKGLTRSRGYERPEPSPAAAAAIRNAILRSRTGHTGIERHQQRGRLDSKGLHRIASQDMRLFHRRNAPSPGKFLVWVMVDCSGSMGGQPIADAAAVAHALAEASTGAPTVRLAVWGWTDPFRQSSCGVGARAGVAKVWETGMPTTEVFKLADLAMGGTPDAVVMRWASRAIARECRTDETPVIVFCSDGWGWGGLKAVIDEARKHNVQVRSVSLGSSVQAEVQEANFGRGNFVEWGGSVLETARPLATMIGRMASGQ